MADCFRRHFFSKWTDFSVSSLDTDVRPEVRRTLVTGWCSNSSKSSSCFIRRLSGAFTINRITNERIYPTNKNNAIAGDFFGSLSNSLLNDHD